MSLCTNNAMLTGKKIAQKKKTGKKLSDIYHFSIHGTQSCQ